MAMDCAQYDRGPIETSTIENASPESTPREGTQSEIVEPMVINHLYNRRGPGMCFLPLPDRLAVVIPHKRRDTLEQFINWRTANKWYVCSRTDINPTHHSHH